MSKKPLLFVALAGNPNSGKTTMFNALTGSRQHVGNYPGITVDRKEGLAEVDGKELRIVDLPGCYSLTAYSAEELVARRVLAEERPDVVVDVIAATSLERNLYLAVQFMELGIPLVLALNMMDEVRKKGMTIDSQRLSELLGFPVVETVARSGQGRQELLRAATAHAQARQEWKPLTISYGPDVDPVLKGMSESIAGAGFLTERYPPRWTAIKYLEGDEEILRLGRQADPDLSRELEERVRQVQDHCEMTLKTSVEAIIADYRYGFISGLLKSGVLTKEARQQRLDSSDALDRFVTHRFLGPLIMFFAIFAMFKITFVVGEIPMSWLETFFAWLGNTVHGLLPDSLVRSLVVSGMIDGVGGILGFVPLIFVMFVMISFLEDLGYMARLAYMLDRVFRIFGLHGCSVMPFIISGGIAGGCAVPGIMATRTLRSPKEKLATLLTAPFMTCGAKLPVFLLLTAAFFPENEAWIMFLITLFGWFMALLVSRLLRSTIIRGESTPFVMELPPYRLPTLRGILMHAWERTWQYIRKAGTIILAVSVLLWAALTFPQLPEEQLAGLQPEQQTTARATEQDVQTLGQQEAETMLGQQIEEVSNLQSQAALRHSLAGRVGTWLEPVSLLAGFDWRTNIALVGGVAAKEIVISTLGTAYSLGEVDPEDSKPLSRRIANDPHWTPVTGVSLIVFVLLYAPCFVTIVAMARESTWRWALFSLVFNTLLAFCLAVAVYQGGRALF